MTIKLYTVKLLTLYDTIRMRFFNILLSYISKKLVMPTTPKMSQEQEIGLFSQVYQNATFRKYIDAREEYLIKMIAENILSGKPIDAHGVSGQLLEIRSLRDRTRGAFIVTEKKKKLSQQNKIEKK